MRAGKLPHPVVRMIQASVTEDVGACGHALLKLFWERGERCLVNAQCFQTIPSERQRYPTLALIDRSQNLCR